MPLSTQTDGFSLLESLLSISQIQCRSLTSPMLVSSGSECTRRSPNRNEEGSQYELSLELYVSAATGLLRCYSALLPGFCLR